MYISEGGLMVDINVYIFALSEWMFWNEHITWFSEIKVFSFLKQSTMEYFTAIRDDVLEGYILT